MDILLLVLFLLQYVFSLYATGFTITVVLPDRWVLNASSDMLSVPSKDIQGNRNQTVSQFCTEYHCTVSTGSDKKREKVTVEIGRSVTLVTPFSNQLTCL